MNNPLLLILMVLMLVMMFNNIRKVRNMKKDEKYILAYTGVLKKEENAVANLNKYIEEETNPELKNKGLLVKVYTDILEGINPSATIDSISFDDIFLADGNYVPEKISKNSDAFVWLLLNLSKARSQSMIDIMDKLYEKVTAYEDRLGGHVEYQVFKAACNCLLERDVKGIEFLNKLLAGEYGDYQYDKQLIGVFKKAAAALLVYSGEPIEMEDEEILYDFALSQVGNRFLSDLELIDRYYKKEEIPEENGQVEEPEERLQTAVIEGKEPEEKE